MDEIERAWLAGWLEGEGSFNFDRTVSQLSVSACSTDRDVLERVRSLLGGNIYAAKKPQEHHRQPWHWRLTGECSAELMAELRPLMFERRRGQIDIALAGYENRRRRGDRCHVVPSADHEEIRRAVAVGPRGTRSRLARQYDVSLRAISRIAKAAN